MGPYIVTIALLTPLLVDDLSGARIAFRWTAYVGGATCFLVLVFGSWSFRGLALAQGADSVETKPLALASLWGNRHAGFVDVHPRKKADLAANCLCRFSTDRPAVAQQYAVTFLGAGFAQGMNDSGQVVGYGGGVGTNNEPTLWNGTSVIILSNLPGGSYGIANGINNAGQVVGVSTINGGDVTTHAVLWNGSTPTDLGTLPGGASSTAVGINAAGQVVGSSTLNASGTAGHAAVWNGTKPTDLGSPLGGAFSYATAINSAGQVVGFSQLPGYVGYQATLWNGTTPTDLGALAGGTTSFAYGINTAGQVVGQSDAVIGAGGATLWNGNTVISLGALGGDSSTALSINNAGNIVGLYSFTSGQSVLQHAALWQSGNGIDLNSLISPAGETLTDAVAINNNGQIAVDGIAANGTNGVYLLSPTSTVPLPAAAWLLVSGLGGLAALGRRRRA